MNTYIQFLVKSTDGSKDVPRLGSDGVYILDGRNTLSNMTTIAERLSKGKSYNVSGFKIIKANRFTDDGKVLYTRIFNITGAYDFIVDLHLRGGAVVNQYICRGGTHIEYTEPNETEVKVKFCNRA